MFGGGSTGDTGGVEIDHRQFVHREETKATTSHPKKNKKSKKKNKVIAKDSKKDFQILMQSKNKPKKQSFVNQNEMSIIDFHKNNQAHQQHEYNYDIPFLQNRDDGNREAPKDSFAPSRGHFAFKPNNMKFS